MATERVDVVELLDDRHAGVTLGNRPAGGGTMGIATAHENVSVSGGHGSFIPW